MSDRSTLKMKLGQFSTRRARFLDVEILENPTRGSTNAKMVCARSATRNSPTSMMSEMKLRDRQTK